MVGAVIRDTRCATRSVLARPAYTLVVIVTIALVVGPSAAVLAVVNASLVRAMPFADGGRLVRIFTFPPGVTGENNRNPLGSLDFVRLREGLRQVESVAGVWALQKSIDGAEEPESVATAAVSANLFSVLGASPLIGRAFTDAEDRANAKVAVLSHALWQRRFASRPDIIGQTLSIDRERYEIVGVMGPAFNAAYVTSELWTPLGMHAGNLILPQATFIQSVARLKPGVRVSQVQAESAAIMAGVGNELATRRGWTTDVATLRDAQFGSARPALMLLLAAIGALALTACANVTNLNVAEVANRRGEMIVRSALGAARRDLIRAHVVENTLLALAGGATGILLAAWILPALLALDPATKVLQGEVSVDWHVQLAAAALALVVSVTAGVVPILWATSGDLAGGLADAGRRMLTSRHHRRVRFVLITVETTMAVILLTAGALLLSAFDRASRTNPGFDPHHVLTAQLRLPVTAYATGASRSEFVRRMLAEVRATPGIIDASTTQNLFIPGFTFVTLVRIEGHPAADGQPYTVNFRRISPGYFRTMRIPELHGRTFDEHDDPTGPPVVIVSRQFAERFWPGADAIGRRIQRASDPTASLTVVGVVGDVSDGGFGLVPAPTIYTAYAQGSVGTASIGLVARTAGDPLESSKAIARAIHAVDPAQPLSNLLPADRYLHASLGPDRFRSVVLTALAALGLMLASIGIYGVSARGVTERIREMGLRLALGGQPRHIRRLVLLQSLAGVGAGLVFGVPAAVLATYVLRRWLPGAETAAPVAGVIAQAALVAAAVVSAGVPAIRAGRVDPLVALRDR